MSDDMTRCGSEKTKWGENFTAVAACVCFGLFWGISYTNFSDALFEFEFATFAETLFRGFFVIAVSLAFVWLKKVPQGLFLCIVVLWPCLTVLRFMDADYSYVYSIGYGLFMAFILCCLGLLLCTFSAKTLYLLVPIGYALGYLYGMSTSFLLYPGALNAILGMIILVGLYLLMSKRNLLSRGGTSKRPRFALTVQNTVKHLLESLSDTRLSLFFGAGALFLVLIGMWFRIGSETASILWLFDYRIGIGCIVSLCVTAFVLTVARGRFGVKAFSFLTLSVFLLVLLANALLWEGAPLIIWRFAGVWLAVCEAVIFVLCFASKASFAKKMTLFGFVQGMVYILLALGNVFESVFFRMMPFDSFSFLLLSLAFAIALIIAMAAELFLRVKEKGVTEASVRNQAAEELPALSSLCGRFGVTSRETEILESYSRGRSTSRIAEDLVLSEHTVRSHLKRAYGKLSVHSRQELIDAIEKESERMAKG